MSRIVFLTVDDLLAIHEHQIRRYGGARGIRDLPLLESARANAEAAFGGAFLHESIHEMAAAYLFGICRNHPFVDGNKRSALAAALVFLRLNAIAIDADEDELVDLVVGTAEGRVSKSAVAVFFETHAV